MWPFRRRNIIEEIQRDIIEAIRAEIRKEVRDSVIYALRAQRDIYTEGWNDGFDGGQNWLTHGTFIGNREEMLKATLRKVPFPRD